MNFNEWFYVLSRYMEKSSKHPKGKVKYGDSMVNIGSWMTNIRASYRQYEELGHTKGKLFLSEHEIGKLKVRIYND